ncbi:MAG: hypothetical protein ACK4N5_10315, partial [Myxococcales bacterium]
MPQRRSEAGRSLLTLQRALYQRQRRRIASIMERPSAAFRAYEARYRRAVREFDREVPLSRLHTELARSDIAYVGDYHTLPRAQQTFAELVDAAVASGRRVVLALEFVQG